MTTGKSMLFLFWLILLSTNVFSQNDTTFNYTDSTYNKIEMSKTGISTVDDLKPNQKSWIRRNPAKALVAPVALIGLGTVLIKNPVYDRFDFRKDLKKTFPNFSGTTVDDYLIYSPYVGLVALNLLKVKCQNDFINTSLIILKAEIINVSLMFALKRLTNIERPNGEKWAWPSGHTSEAFLAATIVNREYRYKSPWYGVAAYGVASTVGFFRMLNNKHWLSDVVAGAGLGIFSANLTYITHKWRWGRPGTCFVPMIMNGQPGMVLVHKF